MSHLFLPRATSERTVRAGAAGFGFGSFLTSPRPGENEASFAGPVPGLQSLCIRVAALAARFAHGGTLVCASSAPIDRDAPVSLETVKHYQANAESDLCVSCALLKDAGTSR